MTGQHQGHDLVAQLPVGHALAGLLVAGGKEHRQQVAPVHPVSPALGDAIVHHPVQRAQGSGEAEVARGGQRARQRDQRLHRLDGVPQDHRQRAADRLGRPLEVQAEQGPPQDGQGGAGHLRRDVDRLTGGGLRAQAVGQLAGDPGHDLAEGGKARLVEGGLGQAALPFPESTVLGDEPAAQGHPQRLEPAGLAPVVLASVLQDALDPAGPADEVPIDHPQLHVGDRPVGARRLHQELQRVGAKGRQAPDDWHAPRPGRRPRQRDGGNGAAHAPIMARGRGAVRERSAAGRRRRGRLGGAGGCRGGAGGRGGAAAEAAAVAAAGAGQPAGCRRRGRRA